MPEDIRRTREPHNRLTRLAAAATDALDAHPEHGNEKAIVFLQDGSLGGLVIHGYDSDSEALADLFIHLTAIFESNGKKLLLLPLGEG